MTVIDWFSLLLAWGRRGI